VELNEGRITTYRVDAQELGLPQARLQDLQVTSPQESAEVIRSVFRGEGGPARDIVLLNSAAALLAAGRAENLKAGLELAGEVIDDGRARETLERVVELSHAEA